MDINPLYEEAQRRVAQKKDEINSISQRIFQRPELAFQEQFASQMLCDVAEQNGFTTTRGRENLQTAFRAELPHKKDGPTIAFLSEYDALPNGHACGHNLIAASGAMAAMIFQSMVEDFDLSANTVLLGCPAEEGGGGKIHMLEQNMFHNVDYAMMIHPCDATMVEDWSLAGQVLTLRFYGRSAHCAASPWLGANALAAAQELVNMVNAWRSQCKDYTRLFPNITSGGKATNVIPDFAEVKYNIRHDDLHYHDELIEMVERCARCSAEAFLVDLKVERSLRYAPVANDIRLEQAMQAAFEALGETVIPRYRDHGIGSTDMGNVTQVLPAIHGHLYLSKENTHTDAFREEAGGAAGAEYVLKATAAMVMTGLGLLENPAKL